MSCTCASPRTFLTTPKSITYPSSPRLPWILICNFHKYTLCQLGQDGRVFVGTENPYRSTIVVTMETLANFLKRHNITFPKSARLGWTKTRTYMGHHHMSCIEFKICLCYVESKGIAPGIRHDLSFGAEEEMWSTYEDSPSGLPPGNRQTRRVQNCCTIIYNTWIKLLCWLYGGQRHVTQRALFVNLDCEAHFCHNKQQEKVNSKTHRVSSKIEM